MRYKKYKDTAAKIKNPTALTIPFAIIFEVTIYYFLSIKIKKTR